MSQEWTKHDPDRPGDRRSASGKTRRMGMGDESEKDQVMPRENPDTIIAALHRLPNTVAVKIHGGPMQTAGLPDIHVLRDGRAAYIEVKRKGQGPRPLQVVVMKMLKQAGGVVGVATNTTEALAILRDGGMVTEEEIQCLS